MSTELSTAIWTSNQEAILIHVLKKAKEDGLQAESGWKPQTFQLVVEALKGTEKESGGIVKGVSHIKSRFQRVRVIFILFILGIHF